MGSRSPICLNQFPECPVMMQRNVMPESISKGLPGTVGPIPERFRNSPAAMAAGIASSLLTGVKLGLIANAGL